MALAHSKVTSQGQVSVPADVRRKLGVVPGSVLEWNEEDDKIVVRRSGRYTSEEVHRAVFRKRPLKRRKLDEMKEGIREYVRKRHVRERHARH